MRKLLAATLAGATVAGGVMIAGTASAQYYDRYGYYHPAPAYADPYYRAAPVNPYYYGDRYVAPSGAANALSVLGSVLGLDTGYMNRVPVDRYGPDPNGMIAPDGHRIKCKLKSRYDSYYRGYVTRRECR
jgi:hypothetical protein